MQMIKIIHTENWMNSKHDDFQIDLETFVKYCEECSPYKDTWRFLNKGNIPRTNEEAQIILKKFPFLTISLNYLKEKGLIRAA